ncbi:MAG: serine/threonine protein kinase [Alphaproteobacteria bacterium]|nr:serine/threonine protein kinase [Alphaproteobacteria bacterium]MCB9758207.1 serine/threonine protein kinase [Alphaproteobacteria bacterium]MCB9795114.1 serine/threonine protein kinase [Alphaproteobacteria bacterium]
MPQEHTRPSPGVTTIGDALANRYLLLRLLSEGRRSKVYAARDARTGSLVAIKALTQRGCLSCRDCHACIMREAFILGRLSHPNVIRCLADHSDAPQPFLALDLAPDGSLQDRMDQGGPLRRRAALLMGLSLIDALEVCHAAGVVHRDIKPQNVLFQHQRTLLADFSVSMHPALSPPPTLRAGAFLAPEVMRADATLTPRADLYGLCATLYYALTGWNPYRIFDASADSPRWASLDEASRDLLYRGTRPDPRARIPGLATLKAEVLHILASTPSEPTSLHRPSPPPDSTDLS